MQQLVEAWDGLAVVNHHDRATGAWVFVGIHTNTLGIPVGGTRMKVYDRLEEGLDDALRLAEGMTYKWATIDVPFGGGKTVIALARPLAEDERVGLLERYADLLNGLNGSFATGEDLGTTPADMMRLAKRTRWVYGLDPATREVRDPGPYTALGVIAGAKACLAHLDGSDDLRDKTVLVQGVGDVGAPLARFASEAGARVLVSDIDGEQATRIASEVGGTVVAPPDVYTTSCDVYAPCAVGQTLNRETIPRLACRIVAGSANNQLDTPEDADRLRDRSILYGPDYVVNAGGATAFGALAAGIGDDHEIRERVARLQTITAEILEEAAERDESPVHAARRRALRVLDRERR
jgi:leucine dehydrogenase